MGVKDALAEKTGNKAYQVHEHCGHDQGHEAGD